MIPINNFGLRQAKKQIIDFLNGLPYDIEVKRLLMKDIYDEAKEEADRTVIREAQEINKTIKEEEEKNASEQAD